ncbi:MAG: sigma-70 family RNA polymerase sigma factor [Planctomycetes bacterium]|nr:sigma-70 family RNA polymerase sigma factor [Planctomycetota bacterium]
MSGNSGSTSALMDRLKRGDEAALAELFSAHRDRLRQIVLIRMDRRLRGRTDASDVLQEAYIDARQRLRHYVEKPEMPFFVWLRQVTMQRLIDTHRHHLGAQMRDAGREISIHGGAPDVMSSTALAVQLVGHLTSPSQTVLRAELIDRVEIGLQHMEPIDREVLVLRHFEELTNNEIAEILGITKAAASNRYVRALSRLRSVLTQVPGLLDDSRGN